MRASLGPTVALSFRDDRANVLRPLLGSQCPDEEAHGCPGPAKMLLTSSSGLRNPVCLCIKGPKEVRYSSFSTFKTMNVFPSYILFRMRSSDTIHYLEQARGLCSR